MPSPAVSVFTLAKFRSARPDGRPTQGPPGIRSLPGPLPTNTAARPKGLISVMSIVTAPGQSPVTVRTGSAIATCANHKNIIGHLGDIHRSIANE
jgi:hypothetical protein